MKRPALSAPRTLTRMGLAFMLAPLLIAPMPLAAQGQTPGPVPEKRAIYADDTDFFGGDLRAIFDTTIDQCESACRAEDQCRALTFNTRASACFLKTDVSRRDPYVGALSAEMRSVAQADLLVAAQRAGELDFLAPGTLTDARAFALRVSRVYRSDFTFGDDALAAARLAANSGDAEAARVRAGNAVAIDDRADMWVAFSRALSAVETDDYSRNRTLRREAILAATNAFLRAPRGAGEVMALQQLAQALEDAGQGRRALDAMQLALFIAPRDDLEEALARLVGLYGFRVTDTQVDSDAPQPRVCVTFSEPLVAGAVDYSDYVALPGGLDLAVTAEDRSLCIAGMPHGARFAFDLRPGLPAQSGEVLERSISQAFYVRDRAPSVRFLGRAYVLPRSQDAAVPIESVNAAQVDVSIYAIPDAGLRGALRNGFVGSPLSQGDADYLAGDLGTPVWQGAADVATELNVNTVTALPVGDAVGDFDPGVYVMTAALPGAEPWDSAATQWFIVTDLGLTTLSGNDGTHVFVRSLNDASARPGVEVALVARSGAELGRVVTDARGFASFPAGLGRGSGGNAPALLTATGADGDYAYLDLTEAGLDLTDRGVEGRDAPPPIDVFAHTERGAYRPGETVHATILARDSGSVAIPGLPLTAILTRPDGVEHQRAVLADAGAGGRALASALPADAQRGTWGLRVYADTNAPALAESFFLVEDFVPERIDFTLDLPDVPLRLGQPADLAIQADFLFGAPGADLAIEGELRVTPAAGLPDWPGYAFGDDTAYFETLYDSLPDGLVTGADGTARVTLIPPVPDTVDRPLELTATLRLRDASGRPVERDITRAIAPGAPMIGVRPLFDGAVPEGAGAGFEVIAVGPDGSRIDMVGARWELTRIRTDYQWYDLGGRWNYERVTLRERVADGTVDLTTGAAARIEAGVDWGRYELRIAATDGGYARTVYGFSAGWYAAGAGSDTPDLLEVSLDREAYAPGDTAQLRLEPRAPGQILVTVASDRLIDSRIVEVLAAGPVTLDLPVTDAWGAGAYVLASHIRPMNVAAGQNPARAVGVGWVPVDPGDRVLDVAFISAGQAAPRGVHLAQLEVSGTPGAQVFATVSAVDVGILNLTAFEDPDPVEHYMGQRRLGLEMRDLYGRLIDGMQGAPGRLRSGGDGGLAGTAAPPPTEDLMAQFYGPLTVGADGRLSVPVDLPDFNGTVRLAAVVWSGDAVGAASQDLLVRDPIVLSAALPRFMAPGDRAELSLDLTHVSGPAGLVSVRVTAEGDIGLLSLPLSATLAPQGRARLTLPMTAGRVGDSRLQVELTTPDGSVLTKRLALGVRANDPQIARQTQLSLAPGGRLDLGSDLLAGMVPGSGRVTLAAGPLARFDVPGLLTALDRYPYGCTEQVTSRALPLLYYGALAADLDLEGAEDLRARIEASITTVLGRQARNGGFGMWNAFSEDLWLDAYVTDFLGRAREAGFAVPDVAWRSAIDNLRNGVNAAPDFEQGGEGIAYALLVLARAGAASIGDLRYYADARADAFATPLALGQLGAALATYGDPGRAEAMFAAASSRLQRGTPDRGGWRSDYGSAVRDRAAVLTLAAESRSSVAGNASLTEAVATAARSAPGSLSTQEQLWTVLAANALSDGAGPQRLTLDGVPVSRTLVGSFDGPDLARPRVLSNQGGAEVPLVVTVFGTPATPEPAQGNGYRIDRGLYDLDGNLVDPQAIEVNARMVVLLTVTPERPSDARLIVDDPLPAGFEIDNPRVNTSGDVGGIEWLDLPDIARVTSAQTDRFVAAVDWGGTDRFQLAYLVRAVSPGQFHHPAALVEDMYRPAYRAQTGAGAVRISSPGP